MKAKHAETVIEPLCAFLVWDHESLRSAHTDEGTKTRSKGRVSKSQEIDDARFDYFTFFEEESRTRSLDKRLFNERIESDHMNVSARRVAGCHRRKRGRGRVRNNYII